MCGRYLVITEDEIIEMKIILEELNQRFSNLDDFIFPKAKAGANFEIAPSATTPVFVFEDNKISPKPMKWGFSRWDGKGSVINARAESVDEKSFFKNAFHNSRCIIPSRGFFEWKKPVLSIDNGVCDPYKNNSALVEQNIADINTTSALLQSKQLSFESEFQMAKSEFQIAKTKNSSKTKNPSQLDFESVFNTAIPTISSPNKLLPGKDSSEKFWIRRADSPMFFMAGIYHLHEGLEEFVILTMPANIQISRIHNRMPVFLETQQLMPWLEDSNVIDELLMNRNSNVQFLISSMA